MTSKTVKIAGPKPPHYLPRNTSLDKDGNVRVHGKVVCSPKGDHVRQGSYFTPKGTKPALSSSVVIGDLSHLSSQDA